MPYDNPMKAPAIHAPTLLVHGGAWTVPPDDAPAHEAGVRRALETGYAVLSRGGSALDAVEAAVTVLEDDPVFDAGCGSFLTSDGRFRLIPFTLLNLLRPWYWPALLRMGENSKRASQSIVESLLDFLDEQSLDE